MKVRGMTHSAAPLLVTREYLSAGRCLNPACAENHLDDLGPHDVAVLACVECGKPALVAWSVARAHLVIGCTACQVTLAIVEICDSDEAIDRVAGLAPRIVSAPTPGAPS